MILSKHGEDAKVDIDVLILAYLIRNYGERN